MPATDPAVRTISLSWQGPFSLRAGTPNTVWCASVSDRCGLYLWAIPTPRGLLLHRVGTTERPFWRRLHEELEAFGRGEYPVHRADSLAQGRRNPLHRGLFGTAECRLRQQQHFRNRMPKLQQEMQRTLSLLAVFLSPFDADRRIGQRIQAAIISRVRSAGGRASTLLETRGAPGDRMPGEEPLTVLSCIGAMVVGLPGEFEA